MRIVVMKFGGTSVASPESRRQIVEKVRESRRRGNSPVVVVSAMGRAPSPYATDSLIGLVESFQGFGCPAEMDQLMATGETLSAIVMAQANPVGCDPTWKWQGEPPMRDPESRQGYYPTAP